MDLSPARLKSFPVWTPYRDDLALGDAAVRARMRFLFTPLPTPTLSAAGARAGLGPDGVTGGDRPQTDGVDMRPDPRLDRPIASRLADDISEAAQMAEAERMGVHVPVEAPVLSATGKDAGLGAFGPSSSSTKAVAVASARDLAMSQSKVGTAGRKATAMASTRVPAISDAGARVGITGKNPIPAGGRGFAMRVPKGPVAQDRERWASGTQDRITAASMGLSLANMDWGDHRSSPPKPQPKRTWVGKQGDATECPENCTEACADWGVAPHAAVNKTGTFRELQKERVPSDVCPPLKSSVGTLEAMLQRDTLLAATAPEELRRVWASRPSMLRSSMGGTMRSTSFKPTAGAMKGLANAPISSKSCGCDDCGCDKKPKPALTSAGIGSAGRRGVSARRLFVNTRLASTFDATRVGGSAHISSAAQVQSTTMGRARSSGYRTSADTSRMNFSVTHSDPLEPFRLPPIVFRDDRPGMPAGAPTTGGVYGLGGGVHSAEAATVGMQDVTPIGLIAPRPREIVDSRLVGLIVRLAIDNPNASTELVWLTAATEAATWARVPTAIPDADLVRAIVAVARRRPTDRNNAGLILDIAIREPLHVEPALLDLIITYARQTPLLDSWDIWTSAWNDRLALGTRLPTPPDKTLFDAIVFFGRTGATREQVLGAAHYSLGTPDPSAPAIWPPYIATELLKWVVFFAVVPPSGTDEEILFRAQYMASKAATPFDPVPDGALVHSIIRTARRQPWLIRTVRDLLAVARADLLTQELDPLRVVQPHEQPVEQDLLEALVQAAQDSNARTETIWLRALQRRALRRSDSPWPRPDRALLWKIVWVSRQMAVDHYDFDLVWHYEDTPINPGVRIPIGDPIARAAYARAVLVQSLWFLGRLRKDQILAEARRFAEGTAARSPGGGLRTLRAGDDPLERGTLNEECPNPTVDGKCDKGGDVGIYVTIGVLLAVGIGALIKWITGKRDPEERIENNPVDPNGVPVPNCLETPCKPPDCTQCPTVDTPPVGGGGGMEGMGMGPDPCLDPCDIMCSLPCGDPATAGCARCPPPGPPPPPPPPPSPGPEPGPAPPRDYCTTNWWDLACPLDCVNHPEDSRCASAGTGGGSVNTQVKLPDCTQNLLGRFFPRLTDSDWAHIVVNVSKLFMMQGHAIAEFSGKTGQLYFPDTEYPYSRSRTVSFVEALGTLAHELAHYDQYLHDYERFKDPDVRDQIEAEASFIDEQVVAYFTANPPTSCTEPTM